MALDGFTPLEVKLDGEGAFSDLLENGPEWQGGTLTQLVVLARGTDHGRPSIALRVVADDGRVVVAQTTWNLLYTAAKAVEARYGPARD